MPFLSLSVTFLFTAATWIPLTLNRTKYGLSSEDECSSYYKKRVYHYFFNLLIIIAIRDIYIYTLRKHAYSNILKILLPKNENFQIKILIFFIFLPKK